MEQETEILSAAQASLVAASQSDRATWLTLFAPYYLIEDPVGSTPVFGRKYDDKRKQRGDYALHNFFDTFIAPNTINYEVTQDYVCGNHVMRDITLLVTMSDKVKITVPMHLLYELAESSVDGKSRFAIQRLAAHWEFIPMIRQLLAAKGSLSVLYQLTVRLLSLQGIGGALGFSKSAFNIGQVGKDVASRFVSGLQHQQVSVLREQCADDAQIYYRGEAVSMDTLLERMPKDVTLSKVIAAGDTVIARVTMNNANVELLGVMLFEFNRRTKKITQARVYLK